MEISEKDFLEMGRGDYGQIGTLLRWSGGLGRPPVLNIAEEIDPDVLEDVGRKVVDDYMTDEQSREEWKQKYQKSLDLAKQVQKPKSFPWPGAANVKYPLVTVAAMQFAARAYPEIVKNEEVVKANVIGYDPNGLKYERGKRVAEHMSWQLLCEMEEWDEETDKLLVALPIIGCMFRKVYFDPLLQRNVSEIVYPDNLVVNYYAKTINMARRVSHVVPMHANEVYERIASGQFLDVELPVAGDQSEQDDVLDRDRGTPPGDDDDVPHIFIEQHRWLDLDDDGYEEPYVVTVHKESQQVYAITARFDPAGITRNNGKIIRIKPVQYFQKYTFLPDPEGGFYDLGFGQLLAPISETIDSILNQLIDAGTLSNAGGGVYSKGMSLGGRKGPVKLTPGEYQPIDVPPGLQIQNAMMPWPVKEPSQTLFSLLGLLIDAGREITSVNNIMSGDTQMSQGMQPTTVMALVEQGMKVFSSIYKRIWRSLSGEYKMLFRLNRLYMPPQQYFEVMDTPSAVSRADYLESDYDIKPVADPRMASDSQRLAMANALLSAREMPRVKSDVVDEVYVKSISPSHFDRLWISDEEAQQMQMAQQQAEAQDPMNQAAMARIRLDLEKTQAEIEKIRSEIGENNADTIKAMASVETDEEEMEIKKFEALLEALKSEKDATQKDQEVKRKAVELVNKLMGDMRNGQQAV